MRSGITIDGQFIGITWHTVDVYFQVVRNIIDQGKSARLSVPGDDGMLSVLITPHSRVSAYVAYEESTDADALRKKLSDTPFGNFPALVTDYLDADSDLWPLINATSLGDEIKKLDDPVEPTE